MGTDLCHCFRLAADSRKTALQQLVLVCVFEGSLWQEEAYTKNCSLMKVERPQQGKSFAGNSPTAESWHIGHVERRYRTVSHISWAKQLDPHRYVCSLYGYSHPEG
ncbi:hypothetical protein KIL84_003588 [Mauremys mutica]|uniref:Uncharacterized protein n=1 Tax=Mauremys mutica TaxID=74926 RepID=A0A9D4ATM4_9SAUR|nr:hypothetical protein KIL84_003588 [Mauremys mutica]